MPSAVLAAQRAICGLILTQHPELGTFITPIFYVRKMRHGDSWPIKRKQ